MKPAFMALAIVSAFATGPAVSAPLNPLAIYTFDAGNADDSSGNGNDGTVVGGVSFVSDGVRGAVAEFGVAAGLSGVDTGVDVDRFALPAVTFGGWFLHDDYGFHSKTMSSDDGGFDRTLGLDFRGGGVNRVSAYTGAGALGGGFVPALGQWYHAAVSYSGTSVQLFVNGALAGTAADSTGSSALNLFLGVNPGFNEDLIGRIDDAFIYARALNATEIADIYQNGFAAAAVPTPAGLPLFAFGLAALGAARLRRRRPGVAS